jgi:HTH-type transcriptional regulator/antitoxin HigA
MKGIQKLIENEAERLSATREIERLWDSEPGTSEAHMLNLLVKLVEIYEKEQFALAPPDPITAVRFRMEQAGLTRKDLEQALGGRNRVSEFLSGARQLSKTMIQKLHVLFGIPYESLLDTGGGGRQSGRPSPLRARASRRR